MIETPFFVNRNQTSVPRPFRRRTPMYGHHVPTETPPPPQPSPSQQPRKVFSIPIHFVNSETKRSTSALKIQKTFRGYRVRKTVKKILELKREVDDVERKIEERETMEVIRRDNMERLKVTESLMALLFRLDGIRGFDDGVREFRKAVIRKAISMQELIDAVSAIDEEDRKKEARECDEIGDNLEEDYGNLDNSAEIGGETLGNCEGTDDLSEKDEEVGGESLENCGGIDNSSEKDEEFQGETLENCEDDVDCKMQVDNSEEIPQKEEEFGEKTLEKGEENGDSWECVGEETEEKKSGIVEAKEEDDDGDAEECEDGRRLVKEESNDEWCVVGGGGGGDDGEEEGKKRDKLLEKMAEDNERLMAMVADLCEKNAMQTRMICSLNQRVEHLEKAMSDRLRKKKKKCSNNATLI